MECKCCKCYKLLAEKEQVKDEHAIWCQNCHNRNRIYGYIAVGVIFVIIVLAIVWIIASSNKEK